MVSGIGPKSILRSQGIDVVADRPGVGQNMWVCSRRSIVVPQPTEDSKVPCY